jgi:hypothetical protein
MSREKDLWFPAKKYGWGWGVPNCWQGWVVIAVYCGLLFGGASLLLPGKYATYFVPYTVVLSIALIGICAWKGETPRWRWGGE